MKIGIIGSGNMGHSLGILLVALFNYNGRLIWEIPQVYRLFTQINQLN